MGNPRRKILLVDDDAAILRVLKYALEEFEFDVVTSESATEALNIFNRQPEEISLLLSDVVMNEMNGLQLAAAIRERKTDMPVIMMSGFISHDVQVREIESKGYAFIAKPFEIKNLIDTIDRMTGDS